MADCAACGTRLEEGITKCPQCGADLKAPGSFLQVLGWVVVMLSTIPIVVGLVTMKQHDYLSLGVGIVIFVAGIIIVVSGRMKTRAATPATRPSPTPAGVPPVPPQ
jgi:hypothetical protein